ncbi:hypothetical protein [Nocardioides sp. B-3]|uniref:hypothetical protein n=1 Tax=Nocardioides sp. B-3 TaxID=2895565 RepID=UPI00215398F1|nr:hypothetical protein [Nocardioides sp. B-3]UUZ60549.1 hypothetical protein LP418_06675 [Nocardioides sp. B-3]
MVHDLQLRIRVVDAPQGAAPAAGGDRHLRGAIRISRCGLRGLRHDPPGPHPCRCRLVEVDKLLEPADPPRPPPRATVRAVRHVFDEAQRLDGVAPGFGCVDLEHACEPRCEVM